MQKGLLNKAETVKSLAQRNGVTVDYINDLVAKGMKFEAEHSRDPHIQRTIAIQHLSEDLRYYSALKKMENQLKKTAPAMEKGGSLEEKVSNTPAGGALVSVINGKQVVHNDGSKGGMFQGRRHTENGIKGIVDGSSPVEVEDEEALIIPEAVNKPGTNNFNGKQLSNKEILSQINTQAGGVPIKKAGGEIKKDGGAVNDDTAGQAIRLKGSSVIITRNALLDDTKKEFNGEMLTNKQILSKINQSGGGAAFADGGNLPEQISCSTNQYCYGGKMMHAEEIATDMNSSCGCNHSMETGGSVKAAEDDLKNNQKMVIQSFLSFCKSPNYRGIYDEYREGIIQLEWGKYGYSVSESQQGSDYTLISQAARDFNNHWEGRFVALPEYSDKYNTVQIVDAANVVKNDHIISGLLGRNNGKELLQKIKKLTNYKPKPDTYKYVFKKHMMPDANEIGNPGFSETFNTIEELKEMCVRYLPKLKFKDVEKKLEAITDFPRDRYNGWTQSEPLLIAKPEAPGNSSGYYFSIYKQKQKRLSFESGGNIYKPNYDRQTIKSIIKEEGLLYAVQHYMDSEAISDSLIQLKTYWDITAKLIESIENLLRKQGISPGLIVLSDENIVESVISDPPYKEVLVSDLPVIVQEMVKELNGLLQDILNEVNKTGDVNSKDAVLAEIATIELPDLFKLAFKGQPWRILKYVQEQAIGMSGDTDGVGENSYDNIVRMVGSEDLVKKCIALLSNPKKRKILHAIKQNNYAAPAGLIESLQIKPKFEEGGTVAGSGAKMMRDLEKDFIFIVTLKDALDKGKSTSGWDINLFKASFYNKVAKLAKNNDTEKLNRIFEFIEKTEKAINLKGPIFTDSHKIWKLKPAAAVIEPEVIEKEYPDRPLRLSDIPESLKLFMPEMQQKAIVGTTELWEVVDNLYSIIQKMPHTYQTEKTPTDEKIVYLHYFFGGSDWYIVEKDKGSGGDKTQYQAFGYAILNGDHEMAEWGYISIEELKSYKSKNPWAGGIELDFYFDPIPFGQLKKKWEGEDEPEDEPEEEPAPTPKLEARPGTFLYGIDYGVPENDSNIFLQKLREQGFGITKMNGPYIVALKPGMPKIIINDNGGEFNMIDFDSNDHIENEPYDTTTGIIPPGELAVNISNIYDNRYKKNNEEVPAAEEKEIEKMVSIIPLINVINRLPEGETFSIQTSKKGRLMPDTKQWILSYINQNMDDDIISIDTGVGGSSKTIYSKYDGVNEGYFNSLLPKNSTLKLSGTMKTIQLDENRQPVNDDDEFYSDDDLALGEKLKAKWEKNAATLSADYGITSYTFDGYDLYLKFSEGSAGSLDLADKAYPLNYSPNRYDSLKEIQEFLLSENTGAMVFPMAEEQAKPRVERDSPKPEISFIDANEPEGISLTQKYMGKKQSVINNAIRDLLREKGIDRNKYSADDLAFLKLYEGAGGLAKQGETGARLLDQFFTPVDICGKMWGIALKYGFKFEGANILEPAVGSGRILQFVPPDSGANVTAYDVDETSYMLCKVLFPDFDIRHGSFEEMFFKGRRHIGLAGVMEQYDLVITNPPYRKYESEWAPLGELSATGAATFEMYFITRGIDVLKPGGLLIMLIPNTFLSNDNKYNDFKNKLIQKADFLNAYRLPNGIFGNTDVGTDILVMRKK